MGTWLRSKFFLPVRRRRYSLGQRIRAKTSKTGESGVERRRPRFGCV